MNVLTDVVFAPAYGLGEIRNGEIHIVTVVILQM